jgi:hypothetical protein
MFSLHKAKYYQNYRVFGRGKFAINFCTKQMFTVPLIYVFAKLHETPVKITFKNTSWTTIRVEPFGKSNQKYLNLYLKIALGFCDLYEILELKAEDFSDI